MRNGTVLGSTGKRFTTVVQIGIGGSDLGPRALYLALKGWAAHAHLVTLDAHFISNVDPDDGAQILSCLNLEQTLFVLVSKSGTTLETLTNQAFVSEAMREAGLDPSRHIVAVTSKSSPLAASDEVLDAFFIDDYIGGRYSSTSAVGGVILSLAYGYETFGLLLDGAHQADRQALNPSIGENAALLDALIGVYLRNVLRLPLTAILLLAGPQPLQRHLQQLDMESNGRASTAMERRSPTPPGR